MAERESTQAWRCPECGMLTTEPLRRGPDRAPYCGADNAALDEVIVLPVVNEPGSPAARTPERHTVQYGPPGRYYVREESTGRAVFSHDSKSEVIGEAERLNGWRVTGSEQAYAERAAEEGR